MVFICILRIGAVEAEQLCIFGSWAQLPHTLNVQLQSGIRAALILASWLGGYFPCTPLY